MHWGSEVYFSGLRGSADLDHTDDIDNDRVFETMIDDLRRRGLEFEVPSDPMTDQRFISLLTQTYDPGKPASYPPEPEELAA
ncbi:MAG: hypothetical protein R3E53_14015 [Myxococcota bacterium]